MRTLKALAAVTVLALAGGNALAGGDIEAGKAKSQPCAACHGPDGNSPTGAFPIIAGQYRDYMIQALKDYQTGARKNPIMAGLAAPLSEQDIEDLAAFYASQESGLYTPEYSEGD